MEAVIACVIVWHTISSFLAIVNIIGSGFGIVNTPSDIYHKSDMNWFGSWLCYIVLIILIPMYYLLLLFRFIFTVGRK